MNLTDVEEEQTVSLSTEEERQRKETAPPPVPSFTEPPKPTRHDQNTNKKTTEQKHQKQNIEHQTTEQYPEQTHQQIRPAEKTPNIQKHQEEENEHQIQNELTSNQNTRKNDIKTNQDQTKPATKDNTKTKLATNMGAKGNYMPCDDNHLNCMCLMGPNAMAAHLRAQNNQKTQKTDQTMKQNHHQPQDIAASSAGKNY